jgi:hypothetical protein
MKPKPLGNHCKPFQFFLLQLLAQMAENGKENVFVIDTFLNSLTALNPNRFGGFTQLRVDKNRRNRSDPHRPP